MFKKKKDDPKTANQSKYKHYKAILSQLSNECQNKAVLNHLMTCDSITTYEAFSSYGITRLPSRVNDLRNMGVDISCEMKYKGKSHYGVYRLEF